MEYCEERVSKLTPLQHSLYADQEAEYRSERTPPVAESRDPTSSHHQAQRTADAPRSYRVSDRNVDGLSSEWVDTVENHRHSTDELHAPQCAAAYQLPLDIDQLQPMLYRHPYGRKRASERIKSGSLQKSKGKRILAASSWRSGSQGQSSPSESSHVYFPGYSEVWNWETSEKSHESMRAASKPMVYQKAYSHDFPYYTTRASHHEPYVYQQRDSTHTENVRHPSYRSEHAPSHVVSGVASPEEYRALNRVPPYTPFAEGRGQHYSGSNGHSYISSGGRGLSRAVLPPRLVPQYIPFQVQQNEFLYRKQTSSAGASSRRNSLSLLTPDSIVGSPKLEVPSALSDGGGVDKYPEMMSLQNNSRDLSSQTCQERPRPEFEGWTRGSARAVHSGNKTGDSLKKYKQEWLRLTPADTSDSKEYEPSLLEEKLMRELNLEKFGLSGAQAVTFKQVFERQLEMLYRSIAEEFNTTFGFTQIGTEFVLDYLQHMEPSEFEAEG